MQDESNNIPREISTTMIYQALSKLMTLFKKILNLLQKLSILKLRSFSIQDSIAQISNLFKQIEQLISWFPQEPSCQNIKIFQRFICRIIETIQFHRHKFIEMNVSSQQIQFTHQLENNFSHFNRQNNISKSLRKTLKIINKYYKINPQLSSRQNNINSKITNQQKVFYVTGQQFRTKKIENKLQTSLSKAMMGINTYFKITNCLGLEYSNFKNISFLSLSNKEQLYHDIYERNASIKRIMTQYSRQFHSYFEKRKNKKELIKKNKLLQFQKSNLSKTQYESQNKSTNFQENLEKYSVSNFKGSFFVQKKRFQIDLFNDKEKSENQLSNQNFIMTQINSPIRKISNKKNTALTLQQRGKNSYHLNQATISINNLKLNLIPKNSFNHTVSLSQKEYKNKNRQVLSLKFKKEKRIMNPSQFYFTKLRRNIQKTKNKNSLYIKVQKQNTEKNTQTIK